MTGDDRARAVAASYIAPRLYMGRRPPEGNTLASFGYTDLVLCAMEWQRPAKQFPRVAVYQCPLDDSADGMTSEEQRRARAVGGYVGALLRAGHRVLVTCNEGRNRSGLVTAIALMTLGYPVEQAIAIVRMRRNPDLPANRPALANDHFVEFLLGLRVMRDRAMMAGNP